MYDELMMCRCLALLRCGLTLQQVSALAGPSITRIHTWGVQAGRPKRRTARCPVCQGGELVADAYVYLLGLYLGDGYIVRSGRTFRLRIVQDLRYPHLVATCAVTMQAMFPMNRVGFVSREGCIEIAMYQNHWPCLFPQHGPGRKHERSIVLEPWQQELVDDHPFQLLRGLIHSDGSRVINRVVTRGKSYEYPRYFFTNASDEIQAMFTDTCDRVGVVWSTSSNGRAVSVARKDSVALLDENGCGKEPAAPESDLLSIDEAAEIVDAHLQSMQDRSPVSARLITSLP
ncbi:MAG: hypothetical protein AB7V43_15560 [Acidimicrobiia bacterium]